MDKYIIKFEKKNKMNNFFINRINKKMSGLIVCNMQNEFCIGNIPIKGVIDIIPIINRIRDKFKIVVYIKDLHPKDHISFKTYGGNWKEHCIEGTTGAEIHKGLIIKDDDIIINKGTLSLYDSQSGFYNVKELNIETKLNDILLNNNINKLYFCGVYFEEYIFSTVMDAYLYKYECNIIEDICLGIDINKKEKTKNYLKQLGINFITSNELN